VGAKPVKALLMIERHFFGDQLLKSFDFDFGFCVPNSRNTMEHIYELPSMSQAQSNTLFCRIFLALKLKNKILFYLKNFQLTK